MFGSELGQTRNEKVIGKVTSGYAYDKGYYGVVGEAHAGLDIQAEGKIKDSIGTPVRAATNGVVSLVTSLGKEGELGYWVAVDETGKNGEFTGRRWWYGHLYSGITLKQGSKVSSGETVIGNAGYYENHLHLMVTNTWAEKASTAETSNGSGEYNSAVSQVRSRTMSPLEAYWKAKNDRSEL